MISLEIWYNNFWKMRLVQSTICVWPQNAGIYVQWKIYTYVCCVYKSNVSAALTHNIIFIFFLILRHITIQYLQHSRSNSKTNCRAERHFTTQFQPHISVIYHIDVRLLLNTEIFAKLFTKHKLRMLSTCIHAMQQHTHYIDGTRSTLQC